MFSLARFDDLVHGRIRTSDSLRVTEASKLASNDLIAKFARFCQIDLRLRPRTVKRNVSNMRKLLQEFEGSIPQKR